MTGTTTCNQHKQKSAETPVNDVPTDHKSGPKGTVLETCPANEAYEFAMPLRRPPRSRKWHDATRPVSRWSESAQSSGSMEELFETISSPPAWP